MPCLINAYNDAQTAAVAVIENLQRRDLNPIEEAESYYRLIQECGLRQDEVAERISKDRTTVSNFLRKATPELGPRAKVKSAAPGEQEEQTDEQEDDAAMPR